MKKLATFGLIAFLCFGNTSCSSSQTILNTKEATANKIMSVLDNTTWILKRIDSADRDFIPTEEQKELTLNFANNYYGTSDGCNGIGGEFVVEDNKITFKAGMSTMRYCGEEMAHLIYKVPLTKSKSIKIVKNQLQLLDENEEVIATYIKKDAE